MEAVMSLHTNRPINEGDPSDSPIFWCGVCCMKLTTPTLARQHLTGHSHLHRMKLKSADEQKENVNAITSLKRVRGPNPIIENKKSKVEQVATAVPVATKKESEIKHCDVCNISLNSETQIQQHYNGAKHKLKTGVLSKPPSGLLTNSRGRRRGEGRTMRGSGRSRDEENGGRSLLTLSQVLHGGHDSSAKFSESHMFMPPYGIGNGFASVFGTRATKPDWSVRGRGSIRGRFSTHKTTGGTNAVSRGRGGVGHMGRGFSRGDSKNRGQISTRGAGKFAGRGKKNRQAKISGDEESSSQKTKSSILKGILKKDTKGMKATVPGAKESINDYFVSAGVKDYFKADEEKKAHVPGAKSSLNQYFVSSGTKDYFKPETLSNNYYRNKNNSNDPYKEDRYTHPSYSMQQHYVGQYMEDIPPDGPQNYTYTPQQKGYQNNAYGKDNFKGTSSPSILVKGGNYYDINYLDKTYRRNGYGSHGYDGGAEFNGYYNADVPYNDLL